MLIDKVAEQVKSETTAIYMTPDFFYRVGVECFNAKGAVSSACIEFSRSQTVLSFIVYTAVPASGGRLKHDCRHPDFVVV